MQTTSPNMRSADRRPRPPGSSRLVDGTSLGGRARARASGTIADPGDGPTELPGRWWGEGGVG